MSNGDESAIDPAINPAIDPAIIPAIQPAIQPAIDPWDPTSVESTYAWPDGLWLRANLVASPAGETVGSTGTSDDLTTSEDREVLRQIRADCDALIVGAASIRAEGWHLAPRGQTFVLSTDKPLSWASCPDPSRVTVWTAASGEELTGTVRRLVEHLVGTGYTSVLCEGGLSTVRALADEDLLNEVCVTVRGSTRAETRAAFLALLPEATACTAHRLMASSDGSTIFSLWRCATDSGS